MNITRKRKEANSRANAHRKVQRKAKLDEDKRLMEKQKPAKKPSFWEELVALEPADGVFVGRLPKLTLKEIAEMSDDGDPQVLYVAARSSKQRGFMLSSEHFENEEDMAEVYACAANSVNEN